MVADTDSLAWLLAPLARALFEREFYEQRLCVVERNASGYYGDLLTDEDLDSVLGANPSLEEVQLVKEGASIPRADYATRRGQIDPSP